ncbi:hypothetical protein Hamer_G007053, partial [Homarus americanus]
MSQQLCGITGQCAVIKGPVDISLKLGEEEETLQVYVADIADPCILGLDYLLRRERQFPRSVAEEGLEKLQLEDQEVRPMVEWMNQSSVRPAWETISGASPMTKNYWAQWDALRLKDGLLQCQWVTTNGLNRFWQTLLPRKM